MERYMNDEEVKRIKNRYPHGAKVVVDFMGDDPNPIDSGTKGIVYFVDDIGTVHCEFENGRSLGLLPGVDKFHRVG